MDGHRGGYPDDSQARWYPGESGYGGPDRGQRGADPRYREDRPGRSDSDIYGDIPQAREATRYPSASEAGGADRGDYFGNEPARARPVDLPTRMTPVAAGGRSGDPLFSPEEAARFHSAAEDAAGYPSGSFAGMPANQPDPARSAKTGGENVYRSRRPGAAALISMVAVVVGLLMVRALAVAVFGPTFMIGGVIASSLILVALPLLAKGLYGLVTGAAHAATQHGFRLWAKPPLAYLVVGLCLVVAAGLAAR